MFSRYLHKLVKEVRTGEKTKKQLHLCLQFSVIYNILRLLP